MLDFSGYEGIPEHTKYSLSLYVEEGYFPGGFLKAVLCNNLMDAIGHADSENLAALPDIARYVYNRIPCGVWGSEDKMGEYSTNKLYERLGKETLDFVHGE